MIESALIGASTLLAAVVSGATGFGFALVATALWSQLLDPQTVTVLAISYTLTLNVAYLPLFWRRIPWRRLWPFALGGVCGVPLGAWALGWLAPATLRPMVGAILLVYGVVMLRRSQLPVLRLSSRAGWWADAAVGWLGGFLGGLAGLSGFVPTIWCALRAEDKTGNRALVQAFILLVSVLGLLWVHRLVGIEPQLQQRLWFGLPFVVAGGALGVFLFSRLDAARFNRLVLWLLVLCGTLLLVRH
ncbi:MAG: sulfite exporter TauE/SafE family protein [Rubrivivax sp.]